MSHLDRRRFLALSAAAAAYPALAAPAPSPGKLRLIFFTDTHTQPELSAVTGTAQAFARIKALKPDLCIQGGDHAFDIAATPRDRSLMLLDLYQHTEHALDGIPIHHVLGNHDVFGRDPASGILTTDPFYGKKAFEQRFNGKTYRSFDRAGYHFILLDSIQITPNREFDAFIDPDQLTWLQADLAALPQGTPILIACHVPIVSAVQLYSPPDDKVAQAASFQAMTHLHNLTLGDPFPLLELFRNHNILAVLQGHTHINEVVTWEGIPFLTSGAVSGNWWRGSRWGTPEGFTVLELSGGKAHWHYETYGWQAPNATPDPYNIPYHHTS